MSQLMSTTERAKAELSYLAGGSAAALHPRVVANIATTRKLLIWKTSIVFSNDHDRSIFDQDIDNSQKLAFNVMPRFRAVASFLTSNPINRYPTDVIWKEPRSFVAISLRQIRYFVSTAELGQITKAAMALRISQSAITSAIKDLEAEIGTALFERLPQGVGLTPAGRQFLSHAYAVLARLDEATAVALGSDDVEGVISVATTYTVMGYFLPSHLQKLKRSFPKIEIRLFELNREAIEEGLLSNRFDIAVLLTSNVQNPDIRKETLLGSQRRLWVAADHRLLRLHSVGLKEVAEESYIMLTVDEAAVTASRYWGETAFQPSIVLRTFSIEAVRSMVANGQGVAILSDMVRRPWSLESKRIETIDLREAIPPMDVGLAWRPTLEFTPSLLAFRDYFRQTSSLIGVR